MNTRQKLTLGIAAIFMVTLTIIGVTYAYFVTRVTNDGPATAVINTAKIGTNYQDNNANVIVDNVLPGEVVYKTFVVNNESEVPVGFAVTIASKRNPATTGSCSIAENEGQPVTTKEACELLTDESQEGGKAKWTWDPLPSFVHSTLGMDLTNRTGDQISSCYVKNAYDEHSGAYMPSTCFNANTYDNILVELYRIENYTEGVLNFINHPTGPQVTGAPAYDASIALNLQTNPDVFEGWTECSYATENVEKTYTPAGTSEEITVNYKAGDVDYSTCNTTGIKKIPVTTDSSYNKIKIEAPYCAATDAVCNESGIYQKGSTVMEQVAAGENQSNYYVLKVTYRNINVNQNIENDASVSLKVNINANAVAAITPNQPLS